MHKSNPSYFEESKMRDRLASLIPIQQRVFLWRTIPWRDWAPHNDIMEAWYAYHITDWECKAEHVDQSNLESYVSLEQDESGSKAEGKRESEKDRPFRLRVCLSELPQQYGYTPHVGNYGFREHLVSRARHIWLG